MKNCGTPFASSAMPFSPLVRFPKFRAMMTWPNSPNASVTMAKVMPEVRSEANPTRSAIPIVAVTAMKVAR